MTAVLSAVRALGAQTGSRQTSLAVLDVMAETVGAAEACLLTNTGGRLILQARRRIINGRIVSELLHPDDVPRECAAPLEFARQTAMSGEIRVFDVACGARETATGDPAGSLLCAPISRGGSPLAVLCLRGDFPASGLSTAALEGMRLLCDLAGLVLENAELSLARKADEVRYRSIFENATVGIVAASANGRILDANPAFAAICGFASAEELQDRVPDLRRRMPDPGDWRRLLCILGAQRIARDFETRFTRPDESVIRLELQARPVFGEDGSLALFEAMVTDVTERRQAEERIRALNWELLKIQETERLRISRDLHDDVAQELSSAKLAFETLLRVRSDRGTPPPDESAATALGLLQSSLVKVRDLSHSLRPPNLDQFGLARSLDLLCEDFARSTGATMDFQAAGLERLELDFDAEINLFRIVQEALNNIRKHAFASQVTIRLVAAHPHLILRVRDNGRGFDPRDAASLANGRGMGLKSLKERAALLGGELRVDAKLGAGTRISLEIPFKEKGHGAR